jgi:hypothetical protein
VLQEDVADSAVDAGEQRPQLALKVRRH